MNYSDVIKWIHTKTRFRLYNVTFSLVLSKRKLSVPYDDILNVVHVVEILLHKSVTCIG